MLLFADEEVKVETVEVTETKTETTTAAPTKEIVADAKPAEAKKPERTANRRPGGNGRPPQRRNNNRRGRPPSEFEEKVIDIARVTTVVKGGRRFSFSALVVIGNKKGKVG